MTHDKLLEKIDECFDSIPADYGQGDVFKALRAVVTETDRPSISDDWRWADGWKCAMLTIFKAIEKELE